MISKDNIKYYILIAFISIILYKAIDSPRQILDSINGLMSFFQSIFNWNTFNIAFKSYDNVFRKKI